MLKKKKKIIKIVASIGALFALAQAYSNCSSPYQLVVEGSTMAANDTEMLKRLASGGTWQIQISSFTQAASSTPLAPLSSLAPASVALNIGVTGTGPTATSTPAFKQNLFDFQAAQWLETSALEPSMAGDSYSVVVLLDAAATGNVFSLNNGTRGDQELAMQFPQPGTIRIVHSTDAADSATLTQTLDVTSGPVVIAVSFGKAATDIALQINGTPSTTALVTQGTPGDSAFVLRQLMLGDSAAGTSFQLGEMDVFTEQLTPATLNTVVRSVAKQWGLGGMNYIPQPIVAPTPTPGPGPNPPPPPPPPPLDGALLYSQNCSGCHGPLASSTKHGILLSQLNEGIADIGEMQSLSGLTTAQRQAIVQALQ